MALGDVHDPQVRGILLRAMLLRLPADGRVDAAAVNPMVEKLHRHHLLHAPPPPPGGGGSGSLAAGAGAVDAGGADPVREWFDRLLLLLRSPKASEEPPPPPFLRGGRAQISACTEATAGARLTDNTHLELLQTPDGLLSQANARWAALVLLTASCVEAPTGRFLSGFALWFAQVGTLCVPSASKGDRAREDGSSTSDAPPPLRAAALRALAALVSRAARLVHAAGVKRELSAGLLKALPPLLKQLQRQKAAVAEEKDAEDEAAVVVEALGVLEAALLAHPSALRPMANLLENALAAHLAAGPVAVRQTAARCLALLPHVAGTAAAWGLLSRRLLFTVHYELDALFMEVEDPKEAAGAKAAVVAAGQAPPAPLLAAPAVGARPSELLPRLQTLMYCLTELLSGPFPVAAPVPATPALLLANRLLAVDGAGGGGGGSAEAGRGADLLLALPTLHTLALDLLDSLMRSLRHALVPHGAAASQLVTDCLRKGAARAPGEGLCPLATCGALRARVYSTARRLLHTLGAGVAARVAAPLATHALQDLHLLLRAHAHMRAGAARYAVVSDSVDAALGTAAPSKKRKKGGAFGASSHRVEMGAGAEIDFEGVAMPLEALTEVACAAFQAIEALLVVGGAQLPERRRGDVDHAVLRVALSVVPEGAPCFLLGGPAGAALRLAALRALLATVLSPRTCRPPNYVPVLELLSACRAEGTSEVAMFCSHAMLTLEPLLHPRAPPLPSPVSAALEVEAAAAGSAGHSHSSRDTWAELDTLLRSDPDTLLARAAPNPGEIELSEVQGGVVALSDVGPTPRSAAPLGPAASAAVGGEPRNAIAVSPETSDKEQSALQTLVPALETKLAPTSTQLPDATAPVRVQGGGAVIKTNDGPLSSQHPTPAPVDTVSALPGSSQPAKAAMRREEVVPVTISSSGAAQVAGQGWAGNDSDGDSDGPMPDIVVGAESDSDDDDDDNNE